MGGREDEESEEQDVGGEAHEVKAKAAPRGPSRSEWEAREASHMPYRSWCPHCVPGRGVASPHSEKKDDDGVRELRRP
eukprot:371056-Lingulodinium_polyedra.AAC.1